MHFYIWPGPVGKARLDEEGKVSDLVRDLVEEDDHVRMIEDPDVLHCTGISMIRNFGITVYFFSPRSRSFS